MDIQEELLRKLLDSNTKSHDQLVETTQTLLRNQNNIEKEVHTLVTRQESVVKDLSEIKDKIKNLEEGRIKDLEDRIKNLEDEKSKNRHFWEKFGKIGGGILVLIGIITGFLKLIGYI